MDQEIKFSADETVYSIGICAMEKKVSSQHMQNILSILETFPEIKIIIFTEDIVLNKDVEVY